MTMDMEGTHVAVGKHIAMMNLLSYLYVRS